MPDKVWAWCNLHGDVLHWAVKASIRGLGLFPVCGCPLPPYREGAFRKVDLRRVEMQCKTCRQLLAVAKKEKDWKNKELF